MKDVRSRIKRFKEHFMLTTGCIGKVRRERKEAIAMARSRRLKHYKCRFCGYYHVGHDTKHSY